MIDLVARYRPTLNFGMECPGSGVLEYEIEALEPGRNRATDTACWHPRGVLGRLCWYALVPAHLVLLQRFTHVIALRALALDDSRCNNS